MKIAIISDVHENLHNLILALREIEEKNAEQIIFLGDFINNGIAMFLANSSIPVFAVWGNNDGNKVAITKTSLTDKSNLTISNNIYDFLEFDGRKIFITHFHDIVDSIAKSGDFDAVFYGHDHVKNKHIVGDCLVVNPGEISASKTGEASYAIYDTEKNDVEFFEVKDHVTLRTDIIEDYHKKTIN